MNIDALPSTSLDDPLCYRNNAEQVVNLCLDQSADLLLADEVEALERLRSLDLRHHPRGLPDPQRPWLQVMLKQVMPVSVFNVIWDESTA